MHPLIEVGGLHVSIYFLIVSLACTVAAFWFLYRAQTRSLNRVTAIDIVLVCLVSGFFGARLLHVFYEEPAYYLEFPLKVFEVWNGGFVFLGGVFAAGAAAILFCLWRREPFWFWADVAAPPIALGYALGRVGCFFNGCCYGKYCELPWATYVYGGLRHPTPLYAALWELIAVAILLAGEKRLRTAGMLFNVWLLLHAGGRIVMEVFRDDPRGAPLAGLSLGIWMSLLLAAMAAANIAMSRAR